MRILLLAAILFGAAFCLGGFSSLSVIEFNGFSFDIDTVRYTVYMVATLVAVEGLWQLFRQRNDRMLETVIDAEKSARAHAEREVQILQDDLKSVTVRADNAEKRVRELVVQLDELEKSRSEEIESLRQALRDVETKLTAAEVKAKQDPEGGTASVVALLGLLQEQGRFLDFLMEDITVYPDDRVSGAARFVHAGCSSVIRQYMDLTPVQPGDTGKPIIVEKVMTERAVRFVGTAAVDFPATGKLLHKGWKATRLVLPKAKIAVDSVDGVVVAPAEVEVAR